MSLKTLTACAVTWICVLALVPAHAETIQEIQPIRIALGETEALLPAVVDQGTEFVSLKGIAAALGLQLASHGDDFYIEDGQQVIRFPANVPGLVRVGDRFISLGADALRQRQDLFLPRASISRLMSAIRGVPERAAEVNESSIENKLRWSLAGAGAQEMLLDVELPRSAGPVRVRLDEQGRYLVELPGAGPVTPPWTHRQLDSSLVQSIEVIDVSDEGFSFRVTPGPSLGEVSADPRLDPPGVALRLKANVENATQSSDAFTASNRRVRRIVIDPGHGGAEDGAVGRSGLKEKVVVLDVARRLASRLREAGFDVVLTRTSDEEVSLDHRAGIANERRADLFVSLHANSSSYRGARGAETFFLAATATDDEARTLAALENGAADQSAVSSENVSVLNAQDSGDLPLILWDMAQTEYLQESAKLAETVQARLNQLLGIRDRGVRQAPFRVLVGATCPAVLVELGFLSNSKEEEKLATEEYRAQLADAIRDAIVSYRDQFAPVTTPSAALNP